MSALAPETVRERLHAGALLVDIRSHDEFAREHIAGARCISMQELAGGQLGDWPEAGVVFYCRSGNRTRLALEQLHALCPPGQQVCVMAGGLDAWRQAGLPVEQDRSQPMELSRQVQIAAGSLVLLGLILGVVVSPWFLIICAFVGGGFVFAGLTGFCGMARLLMKMPWNRRRALNRDGVSTSVAS